MLTAASASYAALFGWSFLAATLVPVGSEPALVVLVRRGHSITLLVAIATLGNYLGACTTYWMARGAARVVRTKEPSWRVRAAGFIARYGQPGLLLSWVPFVGDAIVAAAGAAGMPFGAFSIWTAAGKLVRYGVVAWVATTW